MNQPLITVLMPCYNAAPYLAEALESIINQTYQNLEILCINDGSTDDTGKILEEYATKDTRIQIIHNDTNLKLIKSLNKGIDLAKGDFIARMDADDISAPERIEKELDFMMQNTEVDVVGCTCYVINETGSILSKKRLRQHNSNSIFFASFFYVPIGHPELLIRTKVLKENHFLEEEHAVHTEDYELWTRLLRLDHKLKNIDLPLHYFRINPNSVSRKFTTIQDNNFVECARRHVDAFFHRDIETKIMQVVVNRIQASMEPKHFRKGLKEVRWIKKHFLEKSKSHLSFDDKREISIVYKTHLFDICGQALKKANWGNKLYALLTLLLHADIFLNKNTLRYIFAKF